MIFDLLDNSIACELGVDVELYIETIESMPLDKAEEIITLVWNSESEDDILKAKKIFKQYKNGKM